MIMALVHRDPYKHDNLSTILARDFILYFAFYLGDQKRNYTFDCFKYAWNHELNEEMVVNLYERRKGLSFEDVRKGSQCIV